MTINIEAARKIIKDGRRKGLVAKGRRGAVKRVGRSKPKFETCGIAAIQ